MGGLSEAKDGPHPAQPFVVVVSASPLAADKRREFRSLGTRLRCGEATLPYHPVRSGIPQVLPCAP